MGSIVPEQHKTILAMITGDLTFWHWLMRWCLIRRALLGITPHYGSYNDATRQRGIERFNAKGAAWDPSVVRIPGMLTKFGGSKISF